MQWLSFVTLMVFDLSNLSHKSAFEHFNVKITAELLLGQNFIVVSVAPRPKSTYSFDGGSRQTRNAAAVQWRADTAFPLIHKSDWWRMVGLNRLSILIHTRAKHSRLTVWRPLMSLNWIQRAMFKRKLLKISDQGLENAFPAEEHKCGVNVWCILEIAIKYDNSVYL